MTKIFEIYIRTTPERLWEAITDREIRSKYQFGCLVTSEWTRGSRVEMSHPGAPGLLARGVDADPEILRRPGVPPMFSFRDQDANRLVLIEQA